MCSTSELRDTEDEEAVLRWANPTFMGPSLSLLPWVELSLFGWLVRIVAGSFM